MRQSWHLPQRVGLVFALLASSLAHAGGSTLDAWIANEQKAIDRTVDTQKILAPDIAGQAEKYRPDSGLSFDLKSVWVPESELNVAAVESMVPAELRPYLVKSKKGVRYYRLFVHPESENFYKDLIKKYGATADFVATSTASSRSVLVTPKGHPETPFFVKLSLDVKLGGVVRTIPSGEVARSVGMTQIFANHPEMRGQNFDIIPEVMGIIPKGMERGGQIIRLVPPEVLNGKSQLVPMFSLYADRAGESQTLLEQLAAKAGVSPHEYVRENILKPFAATWSDWAVHHDLVMEAHAQNFLLELDPKGKPTGRFFHRDFGGFNVDLKSPSLSPGEVDKLPHFSDFKIDYHQEFIDKARVQSLETYFEGGFLFNIDKLLSKIDKKYKGGKIYAESRTLFAKSLADTSGVKPKVRGPALISKMDQVLRQAQAAAANQGCATGLFARAGAFVRKLKGK